MLTAGCSFSKYYMVDEEHVLYEEKDFILGKGALTNRHSFLIGILSQDILSQFNLSRCKMLGWML